MRQILACLAALGVAEAASAGAVVQTETRHMVGENAGQVRKGNALFDGTRMRVDTHDGRRAIVYRGDKGMIWIIDHKKKNYLAVEKPTPEALQREAKQRLEALTPEQQAAGRAAAAAVPDIELKETDLRSTIQGIPCREVQVSRGGERVADVCRASYAEAGVTADTFAAVREVQELLRSTLGGLVSDEVRSEGLDAIESFGRIEGIPLRVRAYRKGEIQSETLVTSFSQRSLAEGDFALPDGYTPKVTISITGGGG
jgi:hypothetical protein